MALKRVFSSCLFRIKPSNYGFIVKNIEKHNFLRFPINYFFGNRLNLKCKGAGGIRRQPLKFACLNKYFCAFKFIYAYIQHNSIKIEHKACKIVRPNTSAYVSRCSFPHGGGALCAKGASLNYPWTGAPLPRRWVQSPSAFAVHEGLSGNAASSFFSRNPESHGIRSGKSPQW